MIILGQMCPPAILPSGAGRPTTKSEHMPALPSAAGPDMCYFLLARPTCAAEPFSCTTCCTRMRIKRPAGQTAHKTFFHIVQADPGVRSGVPQARQPSEFIFKGLLWRIRSVSRLFTVSSAGPIEHLSIPGCRRSCCRSQAGLYGHLSQPGHRSGGGGGVTLAGPHLQPAPDEPTLTLLQLIDPC